MFLQSCLIAQVKARSGHWENWKHHSVGAVAGPLCCHHSRLTSYAQVVACCLPSQMLCVRGQSWMPSALPGRCTQNTGRFQPKQVNYCKGCKNSITTRADVEVGGTYYPPVAIFLLFLHFVAIRNFRLINGWFYLSIYMCAFTVVFAERSNQAALQYLSMFNS